MLDKLWHWPLVAFLSTLQFTLGLNYYIIPELWQGGANLEAGTNFPMIGGTIYAGERIIIGSDAKVRVNSIIVDTDCHH